jgi:hypothetical protein
MPPHPTHADFRKLGFIALWLGDRLASEEELDAYLRGQFRAEFGFAIHPPDGPECFVADEPRDVAELLDRFSSARWFLEQAVEDARLMGWERATTALVFYHFRYDSDFDRSSADSPLRFVGNFPYGGV